VLPADFYPGKGFRAGRAIPKGYAVVSRRVRLRAGERDRTRLTCPSGYRMRSLATTTVRLGFLVVRADRDYFLKKRSVRMTLHDQALPRPAGPPSARTARARDVRGTVAGLCRARR
jgi:hypothetical protein